MIKQVLLRNLIKYKEIIEKCCKYKSTLKSDLSLRFWIVWILSCILQRKLRIIILLRNKINSSTVFIKWSLTSAHSKLVTYNDIIISHLINVQIFFFNFVIFFGYNHQIIIFKKRIGGVMVSVLASSPFDSGVESWSRASKVNEIGMYCFFAKHAAQRRKSKHRLARNQGPC
jgi:hypothetical protein